MTAELRSRIHALRLWRDSIIAAAITEDEPEYREVNTHIVCVLAVACARDEMGAYRGSIADLARVAGAQHDPSLPFEAPRHGEAKRTVDALIDAGDLRRAGTWGLVATTTTMRGDEIVSVLHSDAITMYELEGEDHA